MEQLSQAPPANDRSVRITGPDGLDYRSQAVFDHNYRIRLQPLAGALSSAATVRGVLWFNGVQPGGDATLPDFQTWACSLLDRGLVHPGDADAWSATFIDVEGGGRDCTWRIVMVTVPCATCGANSDDRDDSDFDSSGSSDSDAKSDTIATDDPGSCSMPPLAATSCSTNRICSRAAVCSIIVLVFFQLCFVAICLLFALSCLVAALVPCVGLAASVASCRKILYVQVGHVDGYCCTLL